MTRCKNALFSLAAAVALMLGGSLVGAQAPSTTDALPPTPTVRLSEEQRHIIKEIILKDLKVGPQAGDVPTTVGDVVPTGVPLQPIPVEVSVKVPQVRTHSFYVKDDAVVIVDPKDNKVAEKID